MKKLFVIITVAFTSFMCVSAQTEKSKLSDQRETQFSPYSSDYVLDESVEKNTVTSDSTIQINRNNEPFKQPEVIKVMSAVKNE